MNFLSQLGGELRKLFGRRRTYLGYAVFLVMEAIILAVFKLPRSQKSMRDLIETNGLGFDSYYSSLTVTYWVMGVSMFLLGSIYFALAKSWSGTSTTSRSSSACSRITRGSPE